jgi:hypothetical protein
MKKFRRILVLIVLLLGATAFFSCTADKVTGFMPGRYTTNGENEYSISWDTIIVKQIDELNYAVERRTRFRRIRNGIMQAWKHEVEVWETQVEPQTKNLIVLRHGKRIIFYPDSGYLKIGKRKYLKVE